MHFLDAKYTKNALASAQDPVGGAYSTPHNS